MLKRTWWFAVACALASGTTHSEEIGFTEWLQEVSSVAPLRMRGSAPTAVLPGHFRNARRADAVVIYEDSASLCHGPDYQRCLPLGYLPTRSTVAVTLEGVTKLLVLDAMQSIRVCEVDVSERRASLDCKSVNFNKLADYNMTLMADGRLLQIEGTDGKYFCSAAGSSTSCSHVINSDGTLTINRNPEEREMARQHGTLFRPLDDPKKECRVRDGAIKCGKPLRVSEDNSLTPFMMPVIIDMEGVTVQGWRERTLAEVDYTSRFIDRDAPTREGYWRGDGAYGSGLGPRLSPAALPPPPPNYYQQQCLAVCAQQDIDYGDVCKITAGMLFWNPPIAAGYWLACEGGRAYHNMRCRYGICRL